MRGCPMCYRLFPFFRRTHHNIRRDDSRSQRYLIWDPSCLTMARFRTKQHSLQDACLYYLSNIAARAMTPCLRNPSQSIGLDERIFGHYSAANRD